jgi:hypothetical protein
MKLKVSILISIVITIFVYYHFFVPKPINTSPPPEINSLSELSAYIPECQNYTVYMIINETERAELWKHLAEASGQEYNYEIPEGLKNYVIGCYPKERREGKPTGISSSKLLFDLNELNGMLLPSKERYEKITVNGKELLKTEKITTRQAFVLCGNCKRGDSLFIISFKGDASKKA